LGLFSWIAGVNKTVTGVDLSMSDVNIRIAEDSDFKKIVKLNADEIKNTSQMDIKRLRYLDAISAYHKVAVCDGNLAAFILAMRDNAPYDNDNFKWFLSRYESFLYIDRIVVAEKYKGRGIGSLIYNDIIKYAGNEAIPLICCEINLVPPNKPSLAFHAGHGFKEAGRQWHENGKKQVSMQIKKVVIALSDKESNGG